jgi:hypothetical protein
MGRDRAEQPTPDLFSAKAVRDASAPSTKPIPVETTVTDTPAQRHVLPKDLGNAIKHLSDGEFDRLLQVTVEEAKRRGRLPRSVEADLTPSPRLPSDLLTKRAPSTDKTSSRRPAETEGASLTRGQVNAVRAAFKAGVTPSRIARQFGISHSNVRKALASDDTKR